MIRDKQRIPDFTDNTTYDNTHNVTIKSQDLLQDALKSGLLSTKNQQNSARTFVFAMDIE